MKNEILNKNPFRKKKTFCKISESFIEQKANDVWRASAIRISGYNNLNPQLKFAPDPTRTRTRNEQHIKTANHTKSLFFASHPLRFSPCRSTATMSDQGDKTCPLCAEEMDLTDQQLKPCKCGYEICVWCWHHIMDMAEKENTEGRCPACRTPYNKEKIVGMAAKCDKVVAEMSTEKRLSSRKGKSKTADPRKQLSNVRVVQRNLVYIMGLPLSLADEDLLQRKEYFSQYGKVLKVSISRTAAGAIQQFANDTCSVYITYSKEEEAILCIQSVHGFVLDGRPLRACFGTTKYCHAWLRNVPCTNPDCLYLHEIGSQEDSFTKDEIISAYTRSRVQQIAGALNSMQRLSGNVLPPPAEEYCSNSSASADKPISKNAATNSAPSVRGSPPNSSSGRSAALPAGALWGTRASNNQHPPASAPCSNVPLNKKPQTCNPTVFSTAVESTSQVSLLPAYAGKKVVHTEESGTTQEKGKIETLEPVKQHAVADPRTYTSENPTILVPPASSSMNSQLHSAPSMSLKNKDKHMIPTSSTNALDISVMSNGSGLTKDSNDTTNVKIQNVCSDMSSLSIGRHKDSQRIYIDEYREPLPSELTGESVISADEICISREKSDLILDAQSKVMQVATPEMEDDLLTFNEQRHRDPEVIIEKVCSPNLSLSLQSPAQPSGYSPQLTNGVGPVRANMQLDRRTDSVSQPSHVESSTDGYLESVLNCVADLQTISRSYYRLPDEGKRMHMERFQDEAPSENYSTNVDSGESSIISNILSLDFDPCNQSLTSPQNLARFLGETDDQKGSLRVSSSRKLTSNQSRFSFAREEPTNPLADFQPSLSYIEQSFNHYRHGQDFPNSRNYQLDNIGTHNGFSVANNEETVGFGSSFSQLSSNKLSVSRPQMSAPPGFPALNRAPPPGFTSHYERMEQNFDSLHGSYLHDTSYSLHNQHQAPQVGKASNGDIEFMDPAILAVGKGRLPNDFDLSSLDMSSSFHAQSNAFENEGRLQLSLTPHQSQSFADMGDNFSPFGDAYGISSRVVEQGNNQPRFDGISSRVLEQTLANHQSPFSQLNLPQSRNSVMSNGHWDTWNGVQSGNNLGVAELPRTESLGFNKFFTGYEESKFHLPNSGNLYNRTFRM
ncbi:hypothetical protein K7X08_023273 [Anisodus acutangulus]|uniref:CCR4-NOT transcription complex subunit 4 n=1 Tax=Anisodus acutangulus TaxID=402998 RepID=A0A9Q1LI49_9SOLA|nr:hypothetical protein K7X08_023273 [Anisodus acutangulus]